MQLPKELSKEAKIAWKKFTKQLGGIQPKDKASMIILCQSYAEMQAAQARINVEGTVLTYPNKMIGPNPYCKIRDEARKCVNALLKEFGCTPLSRAQQDKLKPKEAVKENEEITY